MGYHMIFITFFENFLKNSYGIPYDFCNFKKKWIIRMGYHMIFPHEIRVPIKFWNFEKIHMGYHMNFPWNQQIWEKIHMGCNMLLPWNRDYCYKKIPMGHPMNSSLWNQECWYIGGIIWIFMKLGILIWKFIIYR